jgi:8-oxo-dGTP diphosphatase
LIALILDNRLTPIHNLTSFFFFRVAPQPQKLVHSAPNMSSEMAFVVTQSCRHFLKLSFYLVFLSLIPTPESQAGRFHRKGCKSLIKKTNRLSYLPRLPRIEEIELGQIAKPVAGVRDSVVAAIVDRGYVLMNLRGGEIGRGEWGVVGGKVDQGETLEAALLRELEEEVGIRSIINPKVIYVHYHHDPLKNQVFRVFVVRAEIENHQIPRIMEEDKILDLRWFSLEEPPAPLFSEFDAYRLKL